MKRIPFISFFTGGGFLDLGLHQAGLRAVWTNENNATFADLYEEAMAGVRKAWKDATIARTISSRDSIVDLSGRRIMSSAFPKGRPRLFGVVGGPPCPDFSNGGVHAGGKGENGKLTGVYLRMVQQLRPEFFIMENVPGLYRFAKHRGYLESQLRPLRGNKGYAIDMSLLSALELGVPQSRDRLFVVGFRMPIARRALGREPKDDETGWFSWPKVKKYASARALQWPTTEPFGSDPQQPAEIPLELTVYAALKGDGDPEKLPNGLEFYKAKSKKFWKRDEGDVSAKSFKRLHRFRFSPTVWYGNQEVHLHPWKPRRLSVREALRIQSVPDAYVLPGDEPLASKFKMICNGVPCTMARKVGASVLEFLRRGKVVK